MHGLNINESPWAEISRSLDCEILDIKKRSGSEFSQTCAIHCSSQDYFVKLSSNIDSLEAEEDGLKALANSKAIRVPKLILSGTTNSGGFLVTELLNLHMVKPSFPRLAQDLIALHRTTGTIFGWHRDNYIGGSHQQNPFCNNWTEFFREARLHYQLSLAQKNGYSFSLQTLGEQVLSGIPEILNHHDPVPSLVHGDLWQGNCGFTTDGVPVIYDPAIYYGDRETDLAMSRLFGGFPQVFYDAYQEAWPLDPGWQVRQLVYNLYHILNHLNLFGRTYLQQAEATARKILSEIR